jgi:hypothetical protein
VIATKDAMIERVALAINAVCFMGCEGGPDGFRACDKELCECRKAARAAVEAVNLDDPFGFKADAEENLRRLSKGGAN